MRPEPFAQCALEDFSGAGLRQLEIGELDATWNLVTGQRSTAVRDQAIARCAGRETPREILRRPARADHSCTDDGDAADSFVQGHDFCSPLVKASKFLGVG